jgi:retron-type reverse transcriptase
MIIVTVEKAWKQKKLAGALFLDVKGAFDYIARKQLLKRMIELKIPGDITRWTDSFLKERKIQLVIDGYTCQERDIKTGVPQRSSVSPILFIIYLSGVFEAIEAKIPIKALSFADDIGFIATGGSIKEIVKTLKKAGKEAFQ